MCALGAVEKWMLLHLCGLALLLAGPFLGAAAGAALDAEGARPAARWASAPPAPGPGGARLADLLPPVLSAGLAGALGLGVWLARRIAAWRATARAGRAELQILLEALRRRAGPAVALRPRPAPDVHCAWCHDQADATVRACPGCGTALHGECWTLSLRCPTLGCRRGGPLARELLASLGAAGPATIQVRGGAV